MMTRSNEQAMIAVIGKEDDYDHDSDDGGVYDDDEGDDGVDSIDGIDGLLEQSTVAIIGADVEWLALCLRVAVVASNMKWIYFPAEVVAVLMKW